MSNSITAPITIIQNTINAPVTLGIIGGGGGDLTSGPVRATNGVSSIANGALTIAMTSGLQTALDAKQATLTNYSTISALTGYPTSFPTTPADINNVGTSKLLGRHGAGTGTAQEIGIDGGLELHGGNLRRAAVTGPVTIAAGGSVSAIADGALTISMVSELENILNSTASAEEVANKQDILVSGTNIRPVAGQSLLGSTNIPALLTDPTGITGAAALSNIVSLTQAQYDAIGSKSSTTLYVIT